MPSSSGQCPPATVTPTRTPTSDGRRLWTTIRPVGRADSTGNRLALRPRCDGTTRCAPTPAHRSAAARRPSTSRCPGRGSLHRGAQQLVHDDLHGHERSGRPATRAARLPDLARGPAGVANAGNSADKIVPGPGKPGCGSCAHPDRCDRVLLCPLPRSSMSEHPLDAAQFQEANRRAIALLADDRVAPPEAGPHFRHDSCRDGAVPRRPPGGTGRQVSSRPSCWEAGCCCPTACGQRSRRSAPRGAGGVRRAGRDRQRAPADRAAGRR